MEVGEANLELTGLINWQDEKDKSMIEQAIVFHSGKAIWQV